MKTIWEKLEQEWRKQLLSYAKGNILEVGVGTGDNFKFYPVRSKITATDTSARIIEQAKRQAIAKKMNVDFIVSPLEKLELPSHSFDTIVCTFSLCTYENPGEILKLFNKWCKPEGLVLVLDYGLSKYNVVSWLQKKWEPFHYKRTGSHVSRDMLGIISSSPLRIKRVEIKYAGIVCLVWASLRPGDLPGKI